MGGGGGLGGEGCGSWPLRRPKKILRIRVSLTFTNGIPEDEFWCQIAFLRVNFGVKLYS